MTTLQTAVDARKLIDELAAFQTSSLQYAQVDQAIWLSKNVSRLQELMTYVVDELTLDGYEQVEHNNELQLALDIAS